MHSEIVKDTETGVHCGPLYPIRSSPTQVWPR